MSVFLDKKTSVFNENPLNDPGDKYDKMKWNFPDSSLKVYYYDNYPYKVSDSRNINKLVYIRNEITRLTQALDKIDTMSLYRLYYDAPENNGVSFDEFLNGINEFIDIHSEKIRSDQFFGYCPMFLRKNTSRFIVNEIPNNKQANIFSGINVPRLRYKSNGPSTGIDKNLRAMYREIYLDINLSNSELRKLIYHELAHAVAGHIQYRDAGNHKNDFELCEDLLIRIGKKIGFLEF